MQPHALASAFWCIGTGPLRRALAERPALAQLARDTCSRSVGNATPYPPIPLIYRKRRKGKARPIDWLSLPRPPRRWRIARRYLRRTQRDEMAALERIAANLRTVPASHVALQLVDRRGLRPPHDVKRDGLMRVAAEAAQEQTFRDRRFGPRPCENAKAINRDRTSQSFKSVLGARIASAFNFVIKLKNIILVTLQTFEFSHGLGQKLTFTARANSTTSPTETSRSMDAKSKGFAVTMRPVARCCRLRPE